VLSILLKCLSLWQRNQISHHPVEEDSKLQVPVSVTRTNRTLVCIVERKFSTHLVKMIHLLYAVAVRVMKTRKILEHNNLVAEVITQLHNKFKHAVITIKQRINILIEEFLTQEEYRTENFLLQHMTFLSTSLVTVTVLKSK
jgi:hypothetical protein